MNEETLSAIKARYNAAQFERGKDADFVVRARHDILALITEVRRLRYRLVEADDLLCRYQQDWANDEMGESLFEDVSDYFLACAHEDDGSTCPSCGAAVPFGEIFDDNLPRGMSKWDSVGLEMPVRCPHCEADLVVTKTENEYNVRVATWLDSVSGNSA